MDGNRHRAFTAIAGSAFALRADGAEVQLRLTEVGSRRSGGTDSGERAESAGFSLLFRGPAEPLLPQRIYRLEHEELGALEIFLVPVGRDDAGGLLYEAVFG